MPAWWRRWNPAKGPQAEDCASSPTATQSAEIGAQWLLDEFNAQRREHDRQFFQLIEEVSAGPQARQEKFSALLVRVRSAFDSAQAKRQDQWRAVRKDLLDYALSLHEFSSARSEGSRDAAAQEGLTYCRQRAEEFRELFHKIHLELQMSARNTGRWLTWRGLFSDAYWTFADDLRLVLDAWPNPSLDYARNLDTQSSYHETCSRSDPLSTTSTAFEPESISLPVSPGVNSADMHALDNVAVSYGGDLQAFDASFHCLELIRGEIWQRVVSGHSTALGTWRNTFAALSSELSAEYLKHPCLNATGTGDGVIAATTMIVTFRAAESKRDMDIQREWKHLLQWLIRRLTPLEKLPEGGSTPYVPTDGPPPQPLTGLTPQNLLRLPTVSAGLPIVSNAQRQREAFRQQQKERECRFTDAQARRRSAAQTYEPIYQADFSKAMSQWETDASQAELRRSTDFTAALEKVRVLHEERIARDCGDMACLVENAFLGAQQHRESAFLQALATLSQHVLSACDAALHRILNQEDAQPLSRGHRSSGEE